ncbi:MAG: capsule assembly Wzi family protein [Gemmatimonas sp.]
MRLYRLSLIFAACALSLSAPLRAQSSLVPALHPVYDWLEMQRVNGMVPAYQHEVRPQSRATVLELLHGLEHDSLKLSRINRNLLREFLNEFDMNRLIANRMLTRDFVKKLPRSFPTALRDRKDPVLYAGQSRDSTFSGAFYAEKAIGALSLNQNGETKTGQLAIKGVKAFANTNFGLGFHIEAEHADIASNRELLARDEKLGSAYGYRAFEAKESASFEAFVSYRRPYLEMHLGRGALAMGAALTDPVVIRPDAPNIGFFRMQVGTPTFNLVLLQGSLYAEPHFEEQVYDGDTIDVKVAPQRWAAIQRLTWKPVNQLTIALHEMTIYSGRGLDFDYINPVSPQFFSQGDGGDRDNTFVGLDVITRPVRGTELFGSLLVDDLNSIPGFLKFDTKAIASVGARQRVLQNVQLGASYTRSDPYMYTHFQRLDTWEQSGHALGQSIGPNATELALRVNSWLPLRTRIMLGARQIKQGLNPVDSSGRQTANVGGDLFKGVPSSYPGLFAGADVHYTRRVELEFETEFIRSLKIAFKLRDDKVTGGMQLPSNRFIDFRLRYGF